jgi:5-(carboxyamino)imidazole ribonucleotide mutase
MNTTPLVGIMMGSDSDLPVMQDAAKVLEELGIGSEVHVLSAHRTPEAVVAYVKDAEERGVKAFIAGAGVAAALPGTIAAHTTLPVIGVPFTSANSAAGGLDAILAIVQMPPGVPVGTVGLNSARNAGILAAQILGTGDAAIRERLKLFKHKMEQGILAKDAKLQEKGFKTYLEEAGLI